MAKITQLLFGLLFFSLSLSAQAVDLEQSIAMRYRNEQLGFILSDISRKYSIPFSYSSNFIPVSKRLTISEKHISLRDGLDKLLASTKIVYAVIGNSVALRIDESKEVITEIKTHPTNRKQEIKTDEIPFLRPVRRPTLVWEHPIPGEVLDRMKTMNTRELIQTSEVADEFLDKGTVQVTLFPAASTNKERAENTVNTFSFNILWGRNGGLNGIEIGGFLNAIMKDMQGFQLAGVGNIVEGDAQGIQLASSFNYSRGFMRGFQLSMVNMANTANVIQLAGLANFANEEFDGLQFALGGNYVGKEAKGLQLAGLLNISEESAKTQIALGLNKTGNIKEYQIGLINIAQQAEGRQIGLVNIANHAEKTPIGLLNFIKNGYKKIELGVDENLITNTSFHFGLRGFYNILKIGVRFNDGTWILGYGLGTTYSVNEKGNLHLEYTITHVNENKFWTKELNLLNQVRLTYDWNANGQTSFFIGPSWNMIASKIRDVETSAIIGSALPYYTIINATGNNTNWKMWLGMSAGIRF